VVKDENGGVTELLCTYDPQTKGGYAPDGRKVRATLHWVSANHAISAQVHQYDRLFNVPYPEDVAEGNDFISNINPDSLHILSECFLEPGLADAKPGDKFQFERIGYFVVDPDSKPDKLIFNQTVELRDTWSKIEKAQNQ